MAPIWRFNPPACWTAPKYSFQIDEKTDASILPMLRRLFPSDEAGLEFLIEISNRVLDMMYAKFPKSAPLKVSLCCVVCELDGIAHVSGNECKEMTNWIASQTSPIIDSITGVVWHEMVHVWQNNNGISSGLVEVKCDYTGSR